MVSRPGLQQQLDQKVQEIKQAVSCLSEEQASRPPARGEWSAKEVLSHLSGSDSAEFVARLKRILDEDTPRIDVTPGVSITNSARAHPPVNFSRRSSPLMARRASFSVVSASSSLTARRTYLC